VLQPQATIIVDVGDDDPGHAIVVAWGHQAGDDIPKLAALDRQLAAFLAPLLALGALIVVSLAGMTMRSRLVRPPFITYPQILKCRVTVACRGCRPIRTTIYVARFFDRSSFCPSHLSCIVSGQSGQDEWSSLP
jgi:hypothetical protein